MTCSLRSILLGVLVLVLATPLAAQQKAATHLGALDSADEAEREAAIEALAKQGKRGAEELVRALTARGASLRTRAGVIEVLGRMKQGGPKILEDLLMQTLDVRTIEQILAALSGIQELGPRAAWTSPLLVKRLEGGFDRGFGGANSIVISTTLMTLGRLGPAPLKVQNLVRKFLKDEFGLTRHSSACALWWLGAEPEEVYGILEKGLAGGEDRATLERAIYALGEMGQAARASLPLLQSMRATAHADTQVTLDEAVRKIEGKQPPDVARTAKTETWK